MFKVSNHHIPSAGEMPDFDGDDEKYYGYHVNQHGEQWVFVYDRESDKWEVRAGDLDWSTVVDIDTLGNFVVGLDELLWLDSCLVGAGVKRLDPQKARALLGLED